MTTRLTTVPPVGRSVVDPVPRLILAVDVEGSTQRTNLMRGELRRIMYALLDRALRATGIDRKHLEHPVDRGDGVLLLFRPHDDVPKTLLLRQLIPTLAALLAEHNATVAQPALRLRLRAVLHAGEVHDDGWGFYGEDLDFAFRLLDSPSAKKALRTAAGSPLVLVVSEEIHTGIVRHGYVDIGPQVQSVTVVMAERRRRGWVHVPPPALAVRGHPADRGTTSLRAVAPPPGETTPLRAVAPPPGPVIGPVTAWELSAVSARAAR
jgi:hypothetical protein